VPALIGRPVGAEDPPARMAIMIMIHGREDHPAHVFDIFFRRGGISPAPSWAPARRAQYITGQ
jgi:hypothetical protein